MNNVDPNNLGFSLHPVSKQAVEVFGQQHPHSSFVGRGEIGGQGGCQHGHPDGKSV